LRAAGGAPVAHLQSIKINCPDAQLAEFATEGLTIKLTTDKVDSDESEDSDQCTVQ
jgi:hypothetical protein